VSMRVLLQNLSSMTPEPPPRFYHECEVLARRAKVAGGLGERSSKVGHGRVVPGTVERQESAASLCGRQLRLWT